MKSLIQSKTFWVNILGLIAMIVGVFSPSVGQFIADHFAAAGSAWAIVNLILRAITKDKIQGLLP